jgi:hypothetical protein
MNTLLMIIAIHALLVGFGLVLGGIMAIAAPSNQEIAAMRAAYEAERAKGWWRGQIFGFRQAMSARARWFEMLAIHWPERPQGRKLVYVGAFCLAIAAAIGYHFGVFDS